METPSRILDLDFKPETKFKYVSIVAKGFWWELKSRLAEDRRSILPPCFSSLHYSSNSVLLRDERTFFLFGVPNDFGSSFNACLHSRGTVPRHTGKLDVNCNTRYRTRETNLLLALHSNCSIYDSFRKSSLHKKTEFATLTTPSLPKATKNPVYSP